jgi:hypothetical protein
MFPKKGNVFPRRDGQDNSPLQYAAVVAATLRSELGDTHRAIKTVMKWTGASERTVKNWFSGEIGPSGHYLLRLIHESNAVLHAVLHAAGRHDILAAAGISVMDGKDGKEIRTAKLARDRQHGGPLDCDPGPSRSRIRPDSLLNDPVNDPVNDPEDDPVSPTGSIALNVRQRWFLGELAAGQGVRMADIVRRWGVAEKTAKRDISGLKASGMVTYAGSFKTGGYRLISR